MYQINSFEDDMDKENKKRDRFDIKKFRSNRQTHVIDYTKETANTPRNVIKPVNLSGNNIQQSLVV